MAKNPRVNSTTVAQAQQALLTAYELQHDTDPVEISADTTEVLIDILAWCAERLEKQKENSRIYQKKSSLVRKLIEEHLSKDELASIDAQARELAEKER